MRKAERVKRKVSLRAEKFKMKGWVTLKSLEKVIIFTKPQEKCVEVNIEVVPIKKG